MPGWQNLVTRTPGNFFLQAYGLRAFRVQIPTLAILLEVLISGLLFTITIYRKTPIVSYKYLYIYISNYGNYNSDT